METIAKILGWTVAIGVFVGWMSLVVAGVWIYLKLSGKKI